jgi:hypothetical protein
MIRVGRRHCRKGICRSCRWFCGVLTSRRVHEHVSNRLIVDTVCWKACFSTHRIVSPTYSAHGCISEDVERSSRCSVFTVSRRVQAQPNMEKANKQSTLQWSTVSPKMSVFCQEAGVISRQYLYVRRVDPSTLAFCLSSHRNSCIRLLFSFRFITW